MDVVRRDELAQVQLPGRVLQRAVGLVGENAIPSRKMTVGFARYSAESGPMEPHHHAEESIYIIDARDGWVRFGASPDNLDQRVDLQAGTVIHFPELEWHVFEYGPGGYVDALVIYGQVDNIRPEDIQR